MSESYIRCMYCGESQGIWDDNGDDYFCDEPCSECDDKFFKIFEIMYEDERIFRWDLHKRLPDSEIDGHEDPNEISWVMLPEGEKWLKQQFQKQFPRYKEKDYWEYASQAHVEEV